MGPGLGCKNACLIIHFNMSMLVNLLLVFLWWITGSPFPWFIYPLSGTLAGFLCHWVCVQPVGNAEFKGLACHTFCYVIFNVMIFYTWLFVSGSGFPVGISPSLSLCAVS
jgi:hypothetical protein